MNLFCDIKEEMDFTDKINIKYNNKHYIFRNFLELKEDFLEKE